MSGFKNSPPPKPPSPRHCLIIFAPLLDGQIVLPLSDSNGDKKYHKWDKVFKDEPSKLFKGCLQQILLCPFLNTWTQITI